MQGILITARLRSKRLAKKHLKTVGGKPIMRYLLERIQKAFAKDISAGDIKVVITTSAEEENEKFREFQSLAEVFFGSIRNIPLRHLQAALRYNLESIIAVDGDDILCSIEGIKAVQQGLKEDHAYITTKGLPIGLNSFGYSTNFLANALMGKTGQILETGWGRIFNHKEPKKIHFNGIKRHKDTLRFTLDYEEDLLFFADLIEKLDDKLYSISDQSLIDFVLKEKIYEHNKDRILEYWKNFYANKNHESTSKNRSVVMGKSQRNYSRR